MSTTTADRLALLLRTKQWQRRELEKRYPSLDFDEIPFSAYRQLWMGRSYVRGLVGAWNAYGRSNTDADRDVLYDYSGHGRDIRLYNFAFEGMSGYGGYLRDMTKFQESGPNNTIVGNTFTINSYRTSVDFYENISGSDLIRMRVRVSGLDYAIQTDGILRLRFYTNGTTQATFDITTDGQYDIELQAADDAKNFNIYLMKTGVTEWNPLTKPVIIEQLPKYPGGLVSDGIDDYGQCVKGFALPDDYTIVAIRKIISGNRSGLASKGGTPGVFVFEATSNNISTNAWSFGQATYGLPMPALFSYQTKISYNGEAITPGTAGDTEANPLFIFTYDKTFYSQCTLYDLRIYDHSLTAEELQAVKDEMMSDYEEATGGGISDIHYVCDFDAKGRSNEEEEPMRSQWIDKAAGKGIGLHNYAYAGMSGWGGYAFDFTDWHSDQEANPLQISKSSIKAVISGFENYQYNGFNFYVGEKNSTKRAVLRITGLPKENAKAELMYRPFDGTTEYITLTSITSDGILTADVPDSSITLVYVTFNKQIVSGITIEQLPLYPGALVSDGVDDYGLTQEAISEEVGTMLVYARLIDESAGGYYILNTNNSSGDNGRLYVWRTGSSNYAFGLPTQGADKPPFVLTRVPQAPALPMYIASSGPGYYSACVIHRLILIREQLDGAQVEFLKWKVGKEYRDWCKANGYEYAINQLTE